MSTHRWPARLALACLSALLAAGPACAVAADRPYFAGRLTPDNIERLPPGGMDAIGGLGDWLLSDGELCAVISSREHPTYLSLHGGVLVDLWHCERANDQWSTAHQQYNLQKNEIPATRDIRAQAGTSSARVTTLAQRQGLETRTDYLLESERPGQLSITTTITRTAPGQALTSYGSSVLHPRSSLVPFTLDTRDPAFSRGFHQPAIDTADRASILASVSPADLQILLGSRHIQPAISYGLRTVSATHRQRDGEEAPLTPFLMGGSFFTINGVFSQPFPDWWTREPGVFSFLASRLMDLAPGDSLVLEQALMVGDRADAASITDRLYRGTRVTGQLDTDEAGIEVSGAAGEPVTFVRPDPTGAFHFRLPVATRAAELLIRTPWGQARRTIAANGDQLDLGQLATGAPGELLLPRGQAMSLVFRSGGGPPIFQDELTGSSVGGRRELSGAESHRVNLSGGPADPTSLRLAPGTYSVYATRGPEYSLTQASVTITAGERQQLALAIPRRVVETPGLMSADFHVHSGVSFDSSLRPAQRIADFVAQGGEILVPTEHHITYDLQPAVADAGLAGTLVSFPGVEITGMIRTPQAPHTIGHANVFPLAADPRAFMGGTLPFEGRRLGQVIGAYRERFPDSVFQLNHPRLAVYDADLAFFNHLSLGSPFDPELPLDSAPNRSLIQPLPGTDARDIDFDALELLSGEAMDGYLMNRRDWFALLREGHYKVATANSDSHEGRQLVAYPRNYLALAADSPGEVDALSLATAVRSGHLYGTTGPLLWVDLDGVPPGGVFKGQGATLRVRVAHAPWVPVDEVRVWRDGELWQTAAIPPNGMLTFDVQAQADGYLFVEVSGQAGGLYAIVAPGLQPFAFANPVFIDRAGDGWRFGE